MRKHRDPLMQVWKYVMPALLLLGLMIPGSAASQDALSGSDSQTSGRKSNEAGEQATDADATQDLQGRKQKSVIAGLLMLGLLCGVFLFLFLVVIFWARRIRKDTTAALPVQSPGDPLWYLRKKQSSLSGGSALDQSESGQDGEVK
ncbi:MAG: hypothetical protein VB858_12370 [Planctomycetaceae bacterium]